MPGDGSVCLAYVHDVEVSYSWHRSVTDAILHDLGNEARMLRGGYLAMRCGTGGIVEARNKTAAMFLDRPAEWLWWIDTDMGFAPDTLYRLLESAHPTKRPVVGALCFAWREVELDGMGGFRCQPVPTLYDWVQHGDRAGFVARKDYERDALVECAGTGSACILIHRSVLEQVGPNPYMRALNPTTGELIGEDLSFCVKLAQHGIPLHVHTGIRTTHHKSVWVGESDFAA